MESEWIRRKLAAELVGERDVLKRKAEAATRQAQNLDPSRDEERHRKFVLEIEARYLRARAKHLSKLWADLVVDGEVYEFY